MVTARRVARSVTLRKTVNMSARLSHPRLMYEFRLAAAQTAQREPLVHFDYACQLLHPSGVPPSCLVYSLLFPRLDLAEHAHDLSPVQLHAGHVGVPTPGLAFFARSGQRSSNAPPRRKKRRRRHSFLARPSGHPYFRLHFESDEPPNQRAADPSRGSLTGSSTGGFPQEPLRSNWATRT